jgi:hypothetical protein
MKRFTAFVATLTCVLAVATSAATADPNNKNSATFACDGLTLVTVLQNDAWSVQVVGSASVFVWKTFTLDGQVIRDVPGNFDGKELITCSGTFVGSSGNRSYVHRNRVHHLTARADWSEGVAAILRQPPSQQLYFTSSR